MGSTQFGKFNVSRRKIHFRHPVETGTDASYPPSDRIFVAIPRFQSAMYVAPRPILAESRK
jgi:hypothetical protein